MAISPLRIALIALGITFIAVWLGAATMGRRADGPAVAGASNPAPPQAAPAEPAWAAPDLGENVARLHERLEQAPAPRPIGRNPFSLSPAAPEAAPGAPGAALPAPAAPALEPAAETGAALTARLLGIAVTETADGPEHIAILTVANEELRLVRVGDRLPGGYRVEEVTARSVTFADETGRGWRLDLPP